MPDQDITRKTPSAAEVMRKSAAERAHKLPSKSLNAGTPSGRRYAQRYGAAGEASRFAIGCSGVARVSLEAELGGFPGPLYHLREAGR